LKVISLEGDIILLVGTDWVDPDDPTVIAENELLGAAASIDAAAKKLASLRPRKSVQVSSVKYHLNPSGQHVGNTGPCEICLIFLVVYVNITQESNILLQ
jgi:hypothetical protein